MGFSLHGVPSCFLVVSQMQTDESQSTRVVAQCESGTQTDLHPVEKNIVKSYEWNEWELRRKATQLVIT